MNNRIILILVLMFLLVTAITPVINSDYTCINISTVNSKDITFEEEIAVIQIGGDRFGHGGREIEIPSSEAYLIKERLEKLADKVDNGLVDGEDFAKEMLTIFREENILPPECTYKNFIEIIGLLEEKLKNREQLKTKNSPSIFTNLANNYKSNIDSMQINGDIPLHVGGLTFFGTFSVGGLFGYTLTIPPFYSEVILETTIFDELNLTAWMVFRTAKISIPGAPSYGFAISAIPIPGLEDYTFLTWGGKVIFGVGFACFDIPIYCYSVGHIQTPIFNACFSILGLDILIYS